MSDSDHIQRWELDYAQKSVKIELDKLKRNIRWLVKRLQSHLDEPNSNPLNIRVEGSLGEPPLTSRSGSEIPERGDGPYTVLTPDIPIGAAIHYSALVGHECRNWGQTMVVKVDGPSPDTGAQNLYLLALGGPLATWRLVYCLDLNRPLPSWNTSPDSKWSNRESQLAGGPPTPDLAASPNSNTKYDDPNGPPVYDLPPKSQRIGVYDYDSLVACLRENFHMVFTTYAEEGDPQNMVQLMASEIQNLRRKLDGYLDNA